MLRKWYDQEILLVTSELGCPVIGIPPQVGTSCYCDRSSTTSTQKQILDETVIYRDQGSLLLYRSDPRRTRTCRHNVRNTLIKDLFGHVWGRDDVANEVEAI